MELYLNLTYLEDGVRKGQKRSKPKVKVIQEPYLQKFCFLLGAWLSKLTGVYHEIYSIYFWTIILGILKSCPFFPDYNNNNNIIIDIGPFPSKHAQRHITFHCQRIDVGIYI